MDLCTVPMSCVVAHQGLDLACLVAAVDLPVMVSVHGLQKDAVSSDGVIRIHRS